MKTVAFAFALASLCFVHNAAQACPNINGTFETHEGGATRTVQLYTKEAGGTFAYRLGAGTGFLPADGLSHAASTESHSGTVSVSCDADSVTIKGEAEGATAVTIKIAKVDGKKIRVATGGAEGIFELARN
jgi:hypothetical protein